MAATTLTELPTSFFAGDTLLLLIGLGQYPADQSWTLTYSFDKEWTEPPGFSFTFSSTASGANHSFTVTAVTTSQWLPGKYHGSASVSDGTQKFTVWNGLIEIKPDASQLLGNYDVRSNAKVCLDNINAVLQGKATRDVLSSTIAGQSIQRMSFAELLQAKTYYEAVVTQEKIALGEGSNNIVVRFDTP